jgi:hypothetical protein
MLVSIAQKVLQFSINAGHVEEYWIMMYSKFSSFFFLYKISHNMMIEVLL